MAYSKYTWVDQLSDLTPARMNNMEQGVVNAEAAGIAVNGVGPYVANAPVDSNGSTSFTVSTAGTYLLKMNVEAWANNVALTGVSVYIDSQLVGTTQIYWNTVSDVMSLVPLSFTKFLSAGNHYVTIRAGQYTNLGNSTLEWSMAGRRVGP